MYCNISIDLEGMDIPENTVSVGFEGSESGSSGKVASLHDTTRDEHPVYQH
jgi:hypothetical protein